MELSTGRGASVSLEEAYKGCERLARTHYENFTVGSVLLPKEKLRHVYAIYAFCRGVDDLGDEVQGDRLRLLDWWEEELRRCYEGAPTHPHMIALQHTIAQFDIPMEPFLKLLKANRMDQTVRRHPTYQDLLYYCDHSANPVGHLFLYLFGYRDRERQQMADYTCTALQLTNFWQDVRRDVAMDRIYVPLEDMTRYSYSEEELKALKFNERFGELMAFEVERTRALFQEGLRLVKKVEGTVRVDIELFTRGGLKVLEAIERQGYDVLSRRPRLSRWTKAGLFLSTWLRKTLS